MSIKAASTGKNAGTRCVETEPGLSFLPEHG
jgi:hypothetical protein